MVFSYLYLVILVSFYFIVFLFIYYLYSLYFFIHKLMSYEICSLLIMVFSTLGHV